MIFSKLKSWICRKLCHRNEPEPSKPCVIPVAWPEAAAWSQGLFTDLDLLLRAPLKPEAIFVVNLPSASSWREGISQIRHWARRGAVCIIIRTSNPVVAGYVSERLGAIKTYQEPGSGEYRYIVPPAGLKRLLGRERVIKVSEN